MRAVAPTAEKHKIRSSIICKFHMSFECFTVSQKFFEGATPLAKCIFAIEVRCLCLIRQSKGLYAKIKTFYVILSISYQISKFCGTNHF